MLGYGIHMIYEDSADLLLRSFNITSLVSCFKRPRRSGTSSEAKLLSMRAVEWSCSSVSNIFHGFFYYQALFSVVRRRDPAHPVKHNFAYDAIGCPHTNLTRITPVVLPVKTRPYFI